MFQTLKKDACQQANIMLEENKFIASAEKDQLSERKNFDRKAGPKVASSIPFGVTIFLPIVLACWHTCFQ